MVVNHLPNQDLAGKAIASHEIMGTEVEINVCMSLVCEQLKLHVNAHLIALTSDL